MSHEFMVVDAFTAEPFDGNPAAIVFAADSLDDRTMGRIASEFNLAETTFVLAPTQPDADVRFRWFTPAVEVDLCGHATIAGVHAMIETGQFAQIEQRASMGAGDPQGSGTRDIIRIQTRSGILEARPERISSQSDAFLVWLELPRPELTPFSLKPSLLSQGLQIPDDALAPSMPVMLTRDRDVLVFVRDVQVLNEIRPNFTRLAEQSAPDRIRGFLVATTDTLTPSIQVQSRFFAPAFGVNEDSVTGSVHGPLLAYLVRHGVVVPCEGLVGATCIQSIPGHRSGLVHVLGRAEGTTVTEVQIGGQCVTTQRGSLLL
ncbi:MAG: PhzF family phenazine biosynthesis protein [Planctomycetes bacterium]|nr:PhzF family phenazine biosynthesis protein [Planctomycetota bacterium]